MTSVSFITNFNFAGKLLTILLALLLVAWVFEKAGEYISPLPGKKAKRKILIAGAIIVVAVNAGNAVLYFDPSLVLVVARFDFCFFITFPPFCYGLWKQ